MKRERQKGRWRREKSHLREESETDREREQKSILGQEHIRVPAEYKDTEKEGRERRKKEGEREREKRVKKGERKRKGRKRREEKKRGDRERRGREKK